MNKPIAVMGTQGKVPYPSFMSTAQLLDKVGANTGNLMFQYSVYNSIKDEKLLLGRDTAWDPKEVNERCHALIVPSANFIREGFDFSNFVNFIDKLKIPIVFAGLGVQAQQFGDFDVELHPSIYKLLDIIRERCPTIGLRGKYTQEVLSEKFNINNTVITGCPSNFLNPDVDLPKKLEEKWNKSPKSLIVTSDEPWPKNLEKRDAERKLIRFLQNDVPGIFVQQSVSPFIEVLRSNNQYAGAVELSVYEHRMNSLRNSIAPDMSIEEFHDFLQSRARVYYDVDQWLEDAARFDLSTGLRLHGNMAPLQSGCPSILIYHDSRTRELAETMGMPRISLKMFNNLDGFFELKEKAICDFSDYASKRKNLAKSYLKVLNNINIQASNHIHSISEA